MGDINALALPAYLDKWAVPYRLRESWGLTWRSSGGFDSMLGGIQHHDAIGPHIADTYRLSNKQPFGTRADGPIGNGSFDHVGVADLWCAHACNTAGKGGPLLGSRGPIPLDNANRTTFNMEARNNGIGEPWTPLQVERIPRFWAAWLDWATHETPGVPLGVGDLWAHASSGPGWTNRKIDPAGPSPWATGTRTWDMHAFRASVFAVQMAGPPGSVTPLPPDEEDDMPKSHVIRASDGTAQQQQAWFILGPDSIAWCRTAKQLKKGRELGWYVNANDNADAAYTAQEIKEICDAMLVGARPPGF